jgi:pimeloyl-ACP methyl ester carboxylesterase
MASGWSLPDRDADPAGYIAAIDARSERIETPCGEGTMVWRVWGNDALQPLVLAHGAQGAWTHWIANIERLARYRRLIVPDLPGHGESALPVTPDHEGISRALAEGLYLLLKDELPVDLCGFSFGGVALGWLAGLHPGVAARLVLVGCGGLGTPHVPPRLGKVGGTRGAERRAVLKGNLLGMMLNDEAAADELAIHMLLPTAKAARINPAPLVLPDMLLRALARVECPVDAIWGACDWPHPDPGHQLAAIRTLKPDCRLRVVADAGHWAMYEKPEPFLAALLDLLGAP